MFETQHLPVQATTTAPDGCDVRVLLGLGHASLAHFQLAPGETSVAVRHRTVEEIWYFLSGHGVMWRGDDRHEEEVSVGPGVAITIPVGTRFQLRSDGPVEPLAAVGITMPQWPGDGEAIRSQGNWAASVLPGPGLADA